MADARNERSGTSGAGPTTACTADNGDPATGSGQNPQPSPLVLHLVTDLRVGGTQVILLERVRHPGPFRHAVACFAIRTGEPSSVPAPDLAAAFADAEVPIHVLGIRTAREALRAAFSGRLERSVRAVLAATRPALIHSTLFHVHLLGAWMARRTGVPHVASKEGIDDWMGPFERRLETWALRSAARVTAVSRATETAARRLGVPAARLTVIPNGIDPAMPGSWVVPSPAEAGAAARSSGPHLIGVGRLDPVKGWDDLLDAAAALRATHPGMRLDLLGSGTATQLARLRARAASLGLAGQVTIGAGPSTAGAPSANGAAPATPPSRERSEGQSAPAMPILVVPSREEGFGLVLLEGMARGMPIVATRAGGIPEVARPEIEAVLVSPRDPPALAAAIARVHADPALAARLAANGRARAEAFPVSAMVDAYHGVYGELIDGVSRVTAAKAGAAKGDRGR